VSKKTHPWNRPNWIPLETRFQTGRHGSLLWIRGEFPVDVASEAGFTWSPNHGAMYLQCEPGKPLPEFLMTKQEAPKPKPQPRTETVSSGSVSSQFVELPVSEIRLDPSRFQNRETEFAEETVQRIIADFQPHKLDPVVVWRNPWNREPFLLSGHSRLEAMKRLGKSHIPCQWFEGTEEEARYFALVEANRGATRESLKASVRAYLLTREHETSKKNLKVLFGSELDYLQAISHLNQEGVWLRYLDQTSTESFPSIKRLSRLVGELRREFADKLTNFHETELWCWFYEVETASRNRELAKEDVYLFVERQVNRSGFNPETDSLALDTRNLTTGAHARADIGAIMERIDSLRARKRLAGTDEERAHLDSRIVSLTEQVEMYGSRQDSLLDALAAA